VPFLEARVDFAELLRKTRLTEREPAGRKDYVTEFKPPSAEAYARATANLQNVRRLTSPVFLSTTADGKRIAGLDGLPPLRSPSAESDPAVETKQEVPPVLFVGNHQLYGFLDLPLVVEEIQRQTGVLVRALAHPVVFQSSRRDADSADSADSANSTDSASRGGPGAINYEEFGAVPVGPRALFKLLQRGEPALLYPGGVREAFKSSKAGENYRLFWPPAEEGSDFARVAARFGATVVPIAAVGAEDGFEMILDADELLALPVLGDRVAEAAKAAPEGRPGERFVAPVSAPKVPERFYFLFGRPIATGAVDPRDKAACSALYAAIQAELEASIQYLLEKRKGDMYRAPLPRVAIEATSGWERQVPSFRP